MEIFIIFEWYLYNITHIRYLTITIYRGDDTLKTEFPIEQDADALIMASLHNLVPLYDKNMGSISLIPQTEFTERVRLLREEGNNEEAYRLLSHMDEVSEDYLKLQIPLASSKSIRIKSTTMYKVLQETSVTMETRVQFMTRILFPVATEFFDKIKGDINFDKSRLVHICFDEWKKNIRPPRTIEV